MNEFINNLLPRLSKLLKTLNNIEILIDRPWVSIEENGSPVKYFFRRNNILLISRKGEVVKGTWEFIDFVNSILLEHGNHKQLFNQGFIIDGLLILKKDSVEEYQVLIDETIIPDYNIESYVQNILNPVKTQTELKNRIIKRYKKSKYTLVINQESEDINVGDTVHFENGFIPPDGKYMTSFWISILVKNGIVQKVI